VQSPGSLAAESRESGPVWETPALDVVVAHLDDELGPERRLVESTRAQRFGSNKPCSGTCSTPGSSLAGYRGFLGMMKQHDALREPVVPHLLVGRVTD
jgi:hypothetical protein